jgi:hypothetical protein
MAFYFLYGTYAVPKRIDFRVFDNSTIKIFNPRMNRIQSRGTKVSLSKTKGLFYLDAGEFIRQSGQIKKTNSAKQHETY